MGAAFPAFQLKVCCEAYLPQFVSMERVPEWKEQQWASVYDHDLSIWRVPFGNPFWSSMIFCLLISTYRLFHARHTPLIYLS
jgi:hypothetical protein